MKAQWFVFQNGVVLGPLTAQAVTDQLGSGELSTSALTWSRSVAEWTALTNWTELQKQQVVALDSESPKVWYCNSGVGEPIGPITEAELVQLLKGFENLDSIQLWTEGMANWAKVYEMPNILDLVGVSKREHPRVPIVGQAVITLSDSSSSPMIAPLQTVSIGGFGAKLSGASLSRGDKVQIMLKSTEFPAAIHATGVVMYVSRAGGVGVRFADVSAEAKTMIFDYVRRFSKSNAVAA